MFKCSICKFQDDYPSLWKRHVNSTSHQKLTLMKENKLICKEENKINLQRIHDMEKDKLQENKLKIQEKINKLSQLQEETKYKLDKLQEQLTNMT